MLNIKTDSHDITVILLKVTLNTLILTLSNASYISSGSKMSFHRLSHSSIISVYFYILLNIFSSRIYMIYLLQDILLKNHKIMLSYLVIKLYSAKAHVCCHILLPLEMYEALDRVRIRVFNVTFNNITVISWLSVLMVEETGVPGEKHRHATCH
jgi:hypothetical protein